MRREKKMIGVFCAGVLVFSMSGCGTVSAQTPQTQQVNTVTSEQNSNEEARNREETGQVKSDDVFIASAKEALSKYFDVNLADTTGYSVDVQHMEALPEYDVEQQVAVTFLPDELNMGTVDEATVIDMENIATKPMYDVSFTEEGTVKGIHLSYTDWKNSEKPVTVELAKELAKEFVISHGLAEEGSLNILGGSATSADTITVVIRHKEGRALVIGVDSQAGRVRFFEDMLEKAAVKSVTPLEEGKGLG